MRLCFGKNSGKGPISVTSSPSCSASQNSVHLAAANPKPTGMRMAAIVLLLVTVLLVLCGCGIHKDSTASASDNETAVTYEPIPTRENGTPSPVGNHLEEIFAGQGVAGSGGSGSQVTFIYNKSTGIFHYSDCRDVDKMKPSNIEYFHGTYNEAIAKGYDPCGHCCS